MVACPQKERSSKVLILPEANPREEGGSETGRDNWGTRETVKGDPSILTAIFQQHKFRTRQLESEGHQPADRAAVRQGRLVPRVPGQGYRGEQLRQRQRGASA